MIHLQKNHIKSSHPEIKRQKNLIPNDIVLLKGDGNYTWAYYTNGSKILFAKTMHTMLIELKGIEFVRTHKSYSINLNHLKYHDMKNDLTLVMSTGVIAEVSRRKRKEFINTVNYFQFKSE